MKLSLWLSIAAVVAALGLQACEQFIEVDATPEMREALGYDPDARISLADARSIDKRFDLFVKAKTQEGENVIRRIGEDIERQSGAWNLAIFEANESYVNLLRPALDAMEFAFGDEAGNPGVLSAALAGTGLGGIAVGLTGLLRDRKRQAELETERADRGEAVRSAEQQAWDEAQAVLIRQLKGAGKLPTDFPETPAVEKA